MAIVFPQEREKDEMMARMKADLKEFDSRLSETRGQLTHAEEVVEQVTAELQRTQVELNKSTERGLQLEASLETATDKCSALQHEVSDRNFTNTLVKSNVSITRSFFFFSKYPQKTLHSLPVRARYGLRFVNYILMGYSKKTNPST